MEGGSSGYYYPANWNIVKDWRGELPFSPISLQYYTGQCWNFSIQECARDIAYLEKHPLKEDISASEKRNLLLIRSALRHSSKATFGGKYTKLDIKRTEINLASLGFWLKGRRTWLA
ncbi:hypothetical protein ACET3Z_027841 [Daucus carota]